MADPKTTQTVIAIGVQVKGNLKCSNDLWFDGLIAGDIDAGGAVTIGPNASVTGNISGVDLTIAGQVHGNLNIKNFLSVTDGAVVTGDIKTGGLEVAKGAILSGSLQMEPASHPEEKA